MALGHVIRGFLMALSNSKVQTQEQRLLMSYMNFSYPYVVAQGHFIEGFHKKFDQEICILTQRTKIRVLWMMALSLRIWFKLVTKVLHMSKQV